MAEGSDGGVAVEDRPEEKVSGDDGSQGALPEGVPEIGADWAAERFRDRSGEVGLDACEGLGDTEQRDLLGLMVSVQPHPRRRSLPLSQASPKVKAANHLRLT